MKKNIKTGIVLLLTIFTLSACNTASEQSSKSYKPTLKIGIDDSYEPYTYIDESGDYAGLDIELATEACEKMGYEPEFIAIKWDNKNEYLSDGSIDCIWSCFSMSGREDEYTWVGPYMYSRQVVAVTKDSDITSLSDLDGKNVAVMSSTKPETIFLEKASASVPEVGEILSMENMDYVFATLQYGYAEAAAGHETVMKEYIEKNSGEYRILDEELQSVEVGVAFDKDNPSEAATALAEAFSSMKEDGSLTQILEEYGVSADTSGGGGA